MTTYADFSVHFTYFKNVSLSFNSIIRAFTGNYQDSCVIVKWRSLSPKLWVAAVCHKFVAFESFVSLNTECICLFLHTTHMFLLPASFCNVRKLKGKHIKSCYCKFNIIGHKKVCAVHLLKSGTQNRYSQFKTLLWEIWHQKLKVKEVSPVYLMPFNDMFWH